MDSIENETTQDDAGLTSAGVAGVSYGNEEYPVRGHALQLAAEMRRALPTPSTVDEVLADAAKYLAFLKGDETTPA